MTDTEFLDRSEALLGAEETEADLDCQRSGAMLTLVFANRSQIIVNLQKPLHEVWLAARSGGYHYKFDSDKWLSTKGEGEFFSQLSEDASAQSGLVLQLAP